MNRTCTRILIASSFILATSSCVPLQQDNCQSDEDCLERFGDTWTCGDGGFCIDAADTGSSESESGEPMECDVMVCDSVINIGTVSAQTGPNENLGTGMVVGVRAALKEVNDAGGIQGRQVNLVVRDDGYEPVNTGSAMEDLTRGGNNRKVLAVVGNVGTPTAIVAIPVAKENEVVFHGAFTGAGVLREDPPARVVFNYRSSYVQETGKMVQYLRGRDVNDRVPPQNIGVLAQGDTAAAQDLEALDGYGTAGFTGVAQALNADNIPEADIAVASYERNTSNTDVATAHFVRWLAGPNTVESAGGVVHAAIIMVPTANPASQLIFEMKDAIEAAQNNQDPQGIPLTDEERTKLAKADLFMASVSFVGSDKLQENLSGQGDKYCSNVAVSQVVPFPTGDSSGAIRYREALQAYADGANEVIDPGFVSFEGYLAGRLFLDGLTNAPTLDTNGVVTGLESLSSIEYGIGTSLGFSVDDHQASERVWGTELNAMCEFEDLDLDV